MFVTVASSNDWLLVLAFDVDRIETLPKKSFMTWGFYIGRRVGWGGGQRLEALLL